MNFNTALYSRFNKDKVERIQRQQTIFGFSLGCMISFVINDISYDSIVICLRSF
jgi:surfactin synthase thioesterase subunit